MDYIIFKNDGSILTQNLTNYIQQGNTGVNQILIAKADILAPTNLTCLGYCTLPDGTNNEMSGVWGGTVEYEGDTYTGWTFTLTSAQTTLNGALVISFVIQNTLNNNIVLTYPVGFVVNKTGYKPDADSGITVEQVNQFLVQLHNYQEKFSEFNVRGYSTEYGANADASNFGLNQIFLVANSGGSISAKIKITGGIYTLPFAVAFSEITGDATSNTSLNTQLNAKEIKANKKTIIDGTTYNDTYFPTIKATKDYADVGLAAKQDLLNSTNALTTLAFIYSGDAVKLQKTTTNFASGTTSVVEESIGLADSSTAGLMSPANVQAISTMQTQISALQGQNIRLLYTASSTPTANEIQTFVIAQGYSDTTKWVYISVVIQATNHIWRYYTNTQLWTDIGIDTVSQFTNNAPGVIKGSESDGQVYAEDNGTGSVVGWSSLKTRVSNVENGKQNKTQWADITILTTDWNENNEYTYDLINSGITVLANDIIEVYPANVRFYGVYQISFMQGSTINKIKFKALTTPTDNLSISIGVIKR